MPSFKTTLIAAVSLLVSLQASAGIVTYSDRATFNAQGTILETSNFDDFQGGFDYPGTPFTRGGVTYTSNQNLIVSQCFFSIGCARSVMSTDSYTPVTGTDANHFNLFGFDVAVTSGTIDITVYTNQASYLFADLAVPDGAPDFAFEGFQATGQGEFFTGFRIDTMGAGYLPGMTDVSLGIAGDGGGAQVPEPGTLALFGLPLATMLALRRRNGGARAARQRIA